jgi:hydroxyacylglutathione hydrolase
MKEKDMQKTTVIGLSLPFKLGSVNCYLIDTGSGYVLIDTGSSNRRADLEKELISAGCKPGSLKLIVLTHGDFDHSGNAAYLRTAFDARIAMHHEDSGMAERGDMFWNRKKGNALLKLIAPVLFGFHKSHRFTPDLYVDDGTDLSDYGLDAQVVHIPGHSKGSIGILTAGGDLFCGDLLENTHKPAPGSIMDDLAAMKASIARLQTLEIGTVYPGHGSPFPMSRLQESPSG